MRKNRIVQLSCLFLWAVVLIANAAKPVNIAFLAFSDIHFDPFYACQKTKSHCLIVEKLKKQPIDQWNRIFQKDELVQNSKYSQDTNYPLLHSFLNAVHDQTKKQPPAFVVILGDFLAHNFKAQYQLYSGDYTEEGYLLFVRKTLQFLEIEIKNALPPVKIFPVLGNNDSYNDDYSSVPNGVFYKDATKIWTNWVGKNSGTFSQTFPIAGYYSLIVPRQKNLRLIALNTVLFTPEAYSKTVNEAASQELNWLAEQLKISKTKHEKVWLLMHVPPGINVFNTIKNTNASVVSFWSLPFLKSFQQIINTYSSTITAILSSHLHMDGFQVIAANNTFIPDTFVPAISPIYHNNPSFKIYDFSTNTLALHNFTTYYLVNNALNLGWQKEYNFNEVYQPHCDKCSLLTGMEKLSAEGKLAQYYQAFFAVENKNAQPIQQGKWFPYYWCGIHHLFPDDYQHCVAYH